MFGLLVVILFKFVKFLVLLLALQVNFLALNPHLIPLDSVVPNLITEYFESGFEIRLTLELLVTVLEHIHLVIVLFDEVLFVRLYSRVDVLQCQMVDLLVDLFELTVDVILSHDIDRELLLLWVVLELLIVEHKFLVFGVLDNACSRRIFVIDYFLATIGRPILHIAVLIKVWQVF